MKQITESEWNNAWTEQGYLRPLCQLPYSVREIEEKFNLSFCEYIEDGLGQCFASFISINNQMCLLRGFINKDDKATATFIEVKSIENIPLSFIDVICQEFNITSNELSWDVRTDDEDL